MFFNYEYLNTLISIKKSLNRNPLEIHDIMGITPVILKIESFSSKNQDYIDTILLFEKYFKELRKDNSNTYKTTWIAISICFIVLFLVGVLVKIGMFLVSL